MDYMSGSIMVPKCHCLTFCSKSKLRLRGPVSDLSVCGQDGLHFPKVPRLSVFHSIVHNKTVLYSRLHLCTPISDSQWISEESPGK